MARACRRHHRAFAWALLHAALPCNAAKVPFWPSDAEGLAAAARCGNAACRHGPSADAAAHPAGELETLLHALLECPAVRPAIRWAAAVWVRIEGGAGPPLTPSVWLQGDPDAWRPRDEHHVHLWHALRIAVLSAAWALRCRRAARGTQFTPADVAAACVVDLRAIVRAEWQRATTDIRRLDGVSSHLFPRRRASPTAAGAAAVVDFELKYCGGGVVAFVAHSRGRAAAVEFRLEPPSGALI